MTTDRTVLNDAVDVVGLEGRSLIIAPGRVVEIPGDERFPLLARLAGAGVGSRDALDPKESALLARLDSLGLLKHDNAAPAPPIGLGGPDGTAVQDPEGLTTWSSAWAAPQALRTWS